MKFTVSSSALLSLLATTGKVISSKNTLPILDYFLMELKGREGEVELKDAFARVDKVAGELGMTIQSGVCTPMCVLNPDDYPNIMFSHCSTDLSNRPLTINYKGEVRFCNHSPRVLGNIYDKTIGEIVSECQNDGYFDKVPEYCTTCNLWSRCRGGCQHILSSGHGHRVRTVQVRDH